MVNKTMNTNDLKKKIKDNINYLLDSGKITDAEIILEEYEKIAGSEEVEVISIKSIIAIYQNDFNKALSLLNKGLAISGNNYDILYNLAYLYFINKDYLNSYYYFNEALSSTKDNKLMSDVYERINELKLQYQSEYGSSVDELLKIRSAWKVKTVDKHSYVKKYKRILYLGWLGQGNMGDDILFDIFKTLLIRAGEDSKCNLIVDSALPISNFELDITRYDLVVLGGGSLYALEFWEDLCLRAKENNIPLATWGTGFDIRDSKSIEQIAEAHENGKTMTLNRDKTAEILKYAELASARGNITYSLLNQEKVNVIGDPCLIFSHLFDSYPQIEEIEGFLDKNDRYVLVNWGTSYNNICGNNEDNIAFELKKCIYSLIDKGYKIIIYPIWTNDIEICQKLYNEIQSQNVYCLKKVYELGYIAGLLAKASFTINFKLHGNIISAAMNKPFIALGYGIKSYDFAESIDCKELVVFTHEALENEIKSKIDLIERSYDIIVEKINHHINLYYEKNFSFMTKILSILDDNYVFMDYSRTVFSFKAAGKNVEIMYNNVFVDESSIEIGDDVYIGFGGYFVGFGGIKIGSGSILAHKVEILTRNHNYNSEDLNSVPYDKRYILRPVEIGENCWIGAHVKILPGVKIGEGAVVGMCSVVTSDVPPYAVVAGHPAKVIKYRDIDIYNNLKSAGKVYMRNRYCNQ